MTTIAELPNNPTKQDLVNAGFRHDETPIELVEIKSIDQQTTDLGVIEQPLPMPIFNKKIPDEVAFKSIHQEFVNPRVRHLSGWYLVYMQDNTAYIKDLSEGAIAVKFNDYFNLKDNPDLNKHLNNDYLAMLKIASMDAKWVTIPEYHVICLHEKANKKYRSERDKWAKQKIKLNKISHQQRVHEQQKYLNQLPFDWFTGIKQVLSGLSANSNGDGYNSRTVVHIRLKEDFTKGRLKRYKHDYLCSPKKVPNWTDTKQEKDDLVTCKACLQRANRLIK